MTNPFGRRDGPPAVPKPPKTLHDYAAAVQKAKNDVDYAWDKERVRHEHFLAGAPKPPDDTLQQAYERLERAKTNLADFVFAEWQAKQA